MDRREAIRKLAAGGAIAATGSAVLSSRDVAYAASAPGTGLVGVPAAGESPFLFENTADGTVRLRDANLPSCTSGELTRLYSWKINNFNIKGGRTWKFFIRNSTDSAPICEGVGPYEGADPSHESVVLRKTNKSEKLKPLDAGDYYDVSVLVTWNCGAGAYLRAEYQLTATYPALPDVHFLDYTVIQPPR